MPTTTTTNINMGGKRWDEECNKNETTPLLLLKPSPGSTDQPTSSSSWSNLLLADSGTAATKKSGSEISLVSLSHHHDDDEEEKMSEYGSTLLTPCRRRRRRAMDCALVLTLIVGFFALRHVVFGPSASSPTSTSSRDVPPGSNSNPSKINDNNKPSSTRIGVFSQLDPVQDLGLTSFQRPRSSRPPPNLESYILKQQQQQQQGVRDDAHIGTNATFAALPNTPPVVQVAIPTNAWYQNLLSVDDNEMPNSIHRAYTIPYIVDAAGPIPGLRVHANHILATQTVIQLNVIEEHGLVVGAAPPPAQQQQHKDDDKDDEHILNTRFHVDNMTPLAITLGWDDYPMTSPIVKGMPYATMRYESLNSIMAGAAAASAGMLPTVASEIPFGAKDSVLVDNGKIQLDCHSSSTSSAVRVNNEVQIYIPANDFTWLVFFSEPVLIRCMPLNNNEGSTLQVVGSAPALDSDDDDHHDYDARDNKDAAPFIIRLALLNTCTNGRNPIYCSEEEHVVHPPKHALSWGQGDYGEVLRSHAHLYPGPNADFSYEVNDDDEAATVTASLQFDWDMQDMGNAIQSSPSTDTNTTTNVSKPETNLIMFSLMHHLDMMGPTPSLPGASNNDLYCSKSLIGPACLIQGSTWSLVDELPKVSFRAPRPLAPWAIPDIAASLRNDITYTLPDYFQRGAGDTYFSGKMLAKLGRILLVAEEIGDLCSGHFTAWERGLDFIKDNQATRAQAYVEACAAVDLPSKDDFTKALDSLRSSTEIWINGTGETPFVYDPAWGGVASCGCNFDGSGCENKFPECPAFDNPGLNFGNAFYNDMHFHYGYHIFAAAVVAHFDHDWGKRHFENVLLLIRNIANPSKEDSFFPVMRHKDVFQGHSWASGISRPYLNGKNQESSSEAIAAYESVALYGKVMAEVFMDNHMETKEYEVARAVRGVGKVMTSMELRSAKRYYHVRRQSGSKSGSSTSESKIFPNVYTPHVIGIMWQTMAQFQTWFGNAPYLAYGIQLLPLTPIAEDRDDVEWVKEMYPSLAASCEESDGCTKDGWSVVQLSSLATVGHAQEAFNKVLTSLPAKVFESAGGNGHSLTNTLWYIATRRPVEEPLPLIEKKITTPTSTRSSPDSDTELTDCQCPETCTDEALDAMANRHSCRERIQWVMDAFHRTQKDACVQVASLEFPNECGSCNPFQNETVDTKQGGKVSVCPPCTDQQCESDLNRCPLYKKSFVCTNGRNTGGCAGSPWTLEQDGDALCTACCELTNCPHVSPQEVEASHDGAQNTEVDDQCPLCSRETCRGEDAPAKLKMPLCPVLAAPYLCQSGSSIGGCSPHPWFLHDGQCEKCCKLTPECGQ